MNESINYEKYKTLCPLPANFLITTEHSKKIEHEKKSELTVTVYGKEYPIRYTAHSGFRLTIDGYWNDKKPYSIHEISGLNNIRTLDYLKLCNTSISDISKLKTFKKIKTLDLHGNRYLEDLEPLKELKELSYLDLSFTKAKDLSPLAELKYLKTLDIRWTDVNDLSHLANLTDLWSLSFSRVKDISVLPSLKSLHQLKFDQEAWEKYKTTWAPILFSMEQLNEVIIIDSYAKGTSYLGRTEIIKLLKPELVKLFQMPESGHGDISHGRNSAWISFDSIPFGSYPQTLDREFEKAIENGTMKENQDYTIDKNGDYLCTSGKKYRKSGNKYFRFQDIIWRVLRNKDGKLLLFADKILDVTPFSSDLWLNNKNTWENSSIRTWLNTGMCPDISFYDLAFSQEEQSAFIQNADKVRLLTLSELTQKSDWDDCEHYGLDTLYQKRKTYIDDTGKAHYSDFAQHKKLDVSVKKIKSFWTTVGISQKGSWWLQDTLTQSNNVIYVNPDGKVMEKDGKAADCETIGVRPVIEIDLLKLKKLPQVTEIFAATYIHDILRLQMHE